MTKIKNVSQSSVHHYIRTTFAALFGIIALVLILASILVVWANRTVTDTSTYVQTVTPLVSQTAVKNFVAVKVADLLEKSAPTQDLAAILLPADQVAGKTPEQLATALTPVIHDSVVQVLDSPRFVALWKNTNQVNHAQLIKQLDANAAEITLDLSPFVNGVMQELKQTKLATIGDKLEISPDSAKLNFKGSQIEQVHKYYKLFKTATVAIVLITLLAIGLCVLISVHHAKTLRRIVAGTGVIALVIAGLIMVPSVATFHTDDPAMQQAVLAIASTLLHNLQIACVIIGFACVFLAIGSKIYDRQRLQR
jgi:hypothetical protein